MTTKALTAAATQSQRPCRRTQGIAARRSDEDDSESVGERGADNARPVSATAGECAAGGTLTPFAIPLHYEDLSLAADSVNATGDAGNAARHGRAHAGGSAGGGSGRGAPPAVLVPPRYVVPSDQYDLAKSASIREAVAVACGEAVPNECAGEIDENVQVADGDDGNIRGDNDIDRGDGGGAQIDTHNNGTPGEPLTTLVQCWWRAADSRLGVEQFKALYWCLQNWSSIDDAVRRGKMLRTVVHGVRRAVAMATMACDVDTDGADYGWRAGAPPSSNGTVLASAVRVAAFIGTLFVHTAERAHNDEVAGGDTAGGNAATAAAMMSAGRYGGGGGATAAAVSTRKRRATRARRRRAAAAKATAGGESDENSDNGGCDDGGNDNAGSGGAGDGRRDDNIGGPAAAAANDNRGGIAESAVDEYLFGDFEWALPEQREAVLEAVARLIESEVLVARCFPNGVPPDDYVNLFCRLSYALLESPTLCKQKRARAVVTRIVGVCVVRYKQSLSAATALLHVLLRQEHVAVPLAEMAHALMDEYRAGGAGEAFAFVRELVRELARTNPRDLARDLAGAKNASAFIAELSDREPEVMLSCMSALLEQLDGESYAMRNGIVHAIGRAVEYASRCVAMEMVGGATGDGGGGGGGGGGDNGSAGNANGANHEIAPATPSVLSSSLSSSSSASMLKSRDALISVLLDRARDVSAYTRTKTLHTWSMLFDKRVLPMHLFPNVAELAATRLDDKTSNVRRAAVQLLDALLRCNPYGAQLDVASFRAKYDEYARALDAHDVSGGRRAGGCRAQDSGDGDTCGTGENDGEKCDNGESGRGDGGDGGGGGGSDGKCDSNGGTGVGNVSTSVSADACTQARAGAEFYANAIEFIGKLDAALPTVYRLLRSRSASDVIESIALLVTARRFNVSGSATAMRSMLVLIMSREPSVRESAVGAYQELLIKTPYETAVAVAASTGAATAGGGGGGGGGDGGGTANNADGVGVLAVARGLIELVQQATVGDLACLEALLHELLRRDKLGATVRQSFWDIAAARVSGSTVPMRRGAIVLIALCAGAAPESVASGKALAVLQEHGFDDLVMARWTCTALEKAARAASKERAPVASMAPAVPPGSRDAAQRSLSMPADAPLMQQMKRVLRSERTEHWFPAAEAALSAMYAVCTMPTAPASEVVNAMYRAALGTHSRNSAMTDIGADDAGSEVIGDGTSNGRDSGDGSSKGSGNTGDDANDDAEREDPAGSGGGGGGGSDASNQTASMHVSELALTRLFFAAGIVAVKHLAMAEGEVARLRKAAQSVHERRGAAGIGIVGHGSTCANGAKRHGTDDADVDDDDDDDDDYALSGAAATAGSGRPESSTADTGTLADQLGAGGAGATDAELEAALADVEAEISAPESLLGRAAPLAARCVLDTDAASSALQVSAALALTRIMCVSEHVAERYLQLLFTVLRSSPVSTVRANAVIALGDLAFRFPNLVEPWTPRLYRALRDRDAHVRKNALMALTHLILNDMIKVKGQIADMAMCLEDDDARIADLARTFFFELSRKGTAHNPIYNLLPDIISCLSRCDRCDGAAFRRIMKFLIGFIDKERQTEAIVEKLCHRFRAAGGSGDGDIADARNIAYCLSLLNYGGERSVKKLADLFKCYSDKVIDDELHAHFTVVLGKARKFAKPEVRAVVDDLEKRIDKVRQVSARRRDTGSGNDSGNGENGERDPQSQVDGGDKDDTDVGHVGDVDAEMESMREKVEEIRLRTPATVRRAAMERAAAMTGGKENLGTNGRSASARHAGRSRMPATPGESTGGLASRTRRRILTDDCGGGGDENRTDSSAGGDADQQGAAAGNKAVATRARRDRDRRATATQDGKARRRVDDASRAPARGGRRRVSDGDEDESDDDEEAQRAGAEAMAIDAGRDKEPSDAGNDAPRRRPQRRAAAGGRV